MGGAPDAPSVAAVCAALLTRWDATRADLPARVATCTRLSALADDAGPHVALTLALAYHETHFGEDEEGAVVGTCQMARSTLADVCRRRGACDHLSACAVKVAEVMSDEEGSELVTLRRWLRGPRGKRGPVDADGERFIGAIRRTRDEIEQRLARAGEPPEV